MKRSSTSTRQSCRDRAADTTDRLDRAVDVVDEEAGAAGTDDLGHRPERVRDHRCPGGQRLDDREPERLGETDQVQQRQRAAEQLVALLRADRPEVRHAGRLEVRFDELPEVVAVLDDPGDDQRKPCSPSHLDGPMGALVGMDAAEEQQVLAGLIAEGEGGEVDAVVDRRVVGQVRMAVRVADRDVVRDVVVGPVDRDDPLGREAVDGRHDRRRHQPAVGERQEVELVAQHVEPAGPLERRRVVQAFVHLDVVAAGILLVAARGLGVQPPRRAGIGGGEQRDVVAEGDQSLRERGRHLLPRPVVARRSAVCDGGEHADAEGGRSLCVGPCRHNSILDPITTVRSTGRWK